MSVEQHPETFDNLGLAPAILQAVKDVGYESPSPIQAQSIPALLSGRDLLGQAQTGTGKTAAFALPLLSRMDISRKEPQLLVLAPTRELAIQVAEAFQAYARHLPDFQVAPIYGGQDFRPQLRQLKRGAQVIVGTPGRIMDHMRRGTLDLSSLSALVLDEADEMLKMGFVDDIQWILDNSPSERQLALFSATMPPAIRDIARRHLRDPAEIKIQSKTSTVETIQQRVCFISNNQKLDALTRILEAEDFDGMIIFARTKNATAELAEKLEARGFSAAALNGDMNQQLRERTIDRLKNRKLDIIVATDVAARGIDVERVSHVVNYDIPYDTEAYVHRIGRTGRAGRTGVAILFVTPRERHMLRSIEKATRHPIEQMQIPSAQTVTERRIDQFKSQVAEVLANQELDFFQNVLERLVSELETDVQSVAAALTYLSQKQQPFVVEEMKFREERPMRERDSRGHDRDRDFEDRPRRRTKQLPEIEPGMKRYRIEVGYAHQVSPREIVGAIANEAGIEGKHIGQITIFDDFTTVDLPDGMPKDIYHHLQKTRVKGQPMRISEFDGEIPPQAGRPPRSGARGPGRPEGGRPARPGSRDRYGDAPPRKRRPRSDD